MSHLEWRHDGRRIFLDIVVMRAEPTDLTHVPARALVDTGATTSGITLSIARSLGLAELGKRPLISAHGLGQAERFLFRVGIIMPDNGPAPAFPFTFPETLGFGLTDGTGLDAVLGMDVLSQCDLSIDRDGRCVLAFG